MAISFKFTQCGLQKYSEKIVYKSILLIVGKSQPILPALVYKRNYSCK